MFFIDCGQSCRVQPVNLQITGMGRCVECMSSPASSFHPLYPSIRENSGRLEPVSFPVHWHKKKKSHWLRWPSLWRVRKCTLGPIFWVLAIVLLRTRIDVNNDGNCVFAASRAMSVAETSQTPLWSKEVCAWLGQARDHWRTESIKVNDTVNIYLCGMTWKET